MLLAVCASMGLHFMVLNSMGFQLPSSAVSFARSSIDVVLVNSGSTRASPYPEVYAQLDLEGGGNTRAPDYRARTPLPTVRDKQLDQQLRIASARLKAEEKRQRHLLSQIKQQQTLTERKVRSRVKPDDSLEGTQTTQQERTTLPQLNGTIERDIQAYQSGPRYAFVGTRAKRLAEAQYIDAWRQKIEKIGTIHYPTGTSGERLSGHLLVTVEIRADGQLGQVQINRGSNDALLDAAALRIVRLAAPFGPLPTRMHDASGKLADVLSITRAWYFTRAGNRLTAVTPESDKRTATPRRGKPRVKADQ